MRRIRLRSMMRRIELGKTGASEASPENQHREAAGEWMRPLTSQKAHNHILLSHAEGRKPYFHI
jgi:hypothetical protein